MLNPIVKGLMQWLYGLFWQAGEYIMNALMDVFSMDMAYFETAVPISVTIMDIMFGVGWALLLGNLVFQAAKSMMTGLGFEGEDPRTLAMRTMVFAFLLVCSRQICEAGLSLGATVVDLLQVPGSVILPSLTNDMFGIDASWLLMIIVGVIIIIQLVKFFLEVGERYVIVGVLTILSPLAFAMGGSKNTADIFKGWVRMYGSMCLMLVMNVVFVKLIISAMAIFPHGLSVFPWLILIIALARVARKLDNIIARVGLNPAITGDGLGRGLPGMIALMVGRNIASGVVNSKFGAVTGAAKSAATVAAAGAAAHGSGFEGRPAPAPVNTYTDSENASGTHMGSSLPFNRPLGRAGSQVDRSNIQHSPGNTGRAATRSGIPVTADDIPARQSSVDRNAPKPPQAARLKTAESAAPDRQSTRSAPRQSGGAAGAQTTSVRGGTVPINSSQSVSQSKRVSAATAYTPVLPDRSVSSADTAKGVTQSQATQRLHQNTQNTTRGVAATTPQPVQPQQQTSATPSVQRSANPGGCQYPTISRQSRNNARKPENAGGEL